MTTEQAAELLLYILDCGMGRSELTAPEWLGVACVDFVFDEVGESNIVLMPLEDIGVPLEQVQELTALLIC
jgi:hypothetical protein